MTDSLIFVVDLEILPGKLDAVRNHIMNAVNSVRENEPGVLIYAYYIDEDSSAIRIIEHYADSQAMLNHLKASESSQFFTMVQPRRSALHGSPSEELRKLLIDFGSKIYSLVDGNFR